jgi:hypothetical protein
MPVQDQLAEPTEAVVVLLLDEIKRYLGVVDVFRAEGVEPVWADEEALFGVVADECARRVERVRASTRA